jgi:radical SAM protein with 4Fe4S-binding SPASM domain
MTFEEYKIIINKIKNYTKEVYLHVLGEPLLHSNINEFINYAANNGLLVNITTNGYLITNIINNQNINRLNISMHSYQEQNNLSLNDYLDNVFLVIDNLRDKTFCSIRLWVSNKYTNNMLKYINERYHTNISEIHDDMKEKITNNLIIDTNHEFIWPNLNNHYYSESGTCHGLIDHIGILSDGTIIPCCLDSQGIINLGNIYNDELDIILKQDIVREMVNGFKNGKKCQELCKHCNFLETNKK